jgi:predicted metal-dependent phosphoesterase TrpH
LQGAAGDQVRTICHVSARGSADLHIHTCFSDGWPTPTDVVEHARSMTDLNVIAITDHDTVEGALRAADYAGRYRRPHVIVGEEVSSREGHIVGLFLKKRVRAGMSAAATIHAMHEQDGLAFAAHPFWRTERGGRRRTIHGVGWLAAELEFDGIEVENATPGFYLFNQLAARLNFGAGRASLGNSDAHILDAIGRAYTSFPGTTPAALRKAIEACRTQAQRERYRALGLVRYAAWSFNHQRAFAYAGAR